MTELICFKVSPSRTSSTITRLALSLKVWFPAQSGLFSAFFSYSREGGQYCQMVSFSVHRRRAIAEFRTWGSEGMPAREWGDGNLDLRKLI